MPRSSIHRPTCSAVISIFTPSAINTLALPLARVTPRLPCFATGAPAPATTKADAVEILNESKRVPPVLHVSTTKACLVVTGVAFDRMTLAAPVISSNVSPFIRSAVMKPAIWASVASPDIISFMASVISASVKFSPSTTFWIASRIILEFLPILIP